MQVMQISSELSSNLLKTMSRLKMTILKFVALKTPLHKYTDQSVMKKVSDKRKEWCSVQNKLKVLPKMSSEFLPFFHPQELSKLTD